MFDVWIKFLLLAVKKINISSVLNRKEKERIRVTSFDGRQIETEIFLPVVSFSLSPRFVKSFRPRSEGRGRKAPVSSIEDAASLLSHPSLGKGGEIISFESPGRGIGNWKEILLREEEEEQQEVSCNRRDL